MPQITRKAILADVRQILKGKLIKLDSWYFYAPELRQKDEDPEEYTVRMVQQNACTVCGMGALFVSFVRLGGRPIGGSDRDKMVSALEPYFSRRTLDLVEMFFEGYTGEFYTMHPDLWPQAKELGELSALFKKDHPDYTSRLLAILDNLERNVEFQP